MDNFFDKTLHYLGRNQEEVFVMNIGAMDGVLFDEMIGYTNMYNFKGLYVEPIPYLFEKLKSTVVTKWYPVVIASKRGIHLFAVKSGFWSGNKTSVTGRSLYHWGKEILSGFKCVLILFIFAIFLI